MKVRYFAQFRDITNIAEETLAGPEDVTSLVRHLGERYGEPMRRALFDASGQEIHPDVFLLLNGRHLRMAGGMAAPLSDGDTVSLLPITEAG